MTSLIKIINTLFFILFFTNYFGQTIPITFKCYNANAKEIYLSGNFNSWQSANPNYKLISKNNDGNFELTKNLLAGTYLYKFVIDGEWVEDKLNPENDGDQYKNSLINVNDPMIYYFTPLNKNQIYSELNLPIINALTSVNLNQQINFKNLNLKINNKNIILHENNFNGITKEFTYQIKKEDIIEGENSLELTLTTLNGTITQQRFIQISDIPNFKILTQNIKFPSKNIKFYGKLLSKNNDSMIVLHNGKRFPTIIKNDSIFYTPIILSNGVNTFEVKAYNKYGMKNESTTIDYKEDLNLDIKIISKINSRKITLSSEITSQFNSNFTYVWSQPETTPISIISTPTNTKDITLNIPEIIGEFFIQLKVIDEKGNSNISGCIIKSTKDEIRILNDDESPEWINKMILYEIGSYGYNYDKSNLSGIISKLDHIAKLGVNTIWLTPIFEGEGNGYWTTDYFKISSNLGNKEEFKILVEQAHKKGLKIILDLVINHTWEKHPFYQEIKELKSESNYANWFIWDGKPGESNHAFYYDWKVLPNLNVNDTNVTNYLTNVAEYWVREFNIDGYRCDVAWGIELRNSLFWNKLRERLKKIKPSIFLLAEGDISNIHEGKNMNLFDNKFDAAYDWNFRGWGNTGIVALLNNQLDINSFHNIITRNFGHTKFPMRFIDNHDHTRAAKEFGLKKMMLAESIIFTINGVPLIYGGDEMGETMQYNISNWNDTSMMLPYLKKLIDIRKKYIFNNSKSTILKNTYPTNVYSYINKSDSNYILTIGNFSSSIKKVAIDFDTFEGLAYDYEVLDLITNTKQIFTHESLKSFLFEIPGWESKIYKISPKTNYFLNTTLDSIVLNNIQQELKFEIFSNTKWNIQSNTDWIQSNSKEGNNNETILLKINKNNTLKTREGILTITGIGIYPKQIMIKQESNVGLSENNLNSNFLISPNPTSDFIYFNYDNNCDKVRVINELGKEIDILEIKNGKIDLRQLSQGIYFINNYCHDTIKETWKIIKLD